MTAHHLPPEIFVSALGALPEALSLADARAPGQPLVWVNAAYCQLVGYPGEQVVGRNASYLQGDDRDQPALDELRAAIAAEVACTVRLRNYRRDGTVWHHRMSLQPLRDAGGTLTHWLGRHAEVAREEAVDIALGPPPIPRDDRLTGLASATYFAEMAARDWALAQREGRTITLMCFDIDALGIYNATFGRVAGDAAIRRVARVLHHGLRRASDLLARLEGGCFVALAAGMTPEQASKHVQMLLDRVRELHIHHPRSPVARHVTVAAACATVRPVPGEPMMALEQRVEAALAEAQANGGNRLIQVKTEP